MLENLDRKKSFVVVITSLLKIAKAVPIFKQGSRLLCTNYRPLSVLPALSNIFEKCVLNQLMFHISFHNLSVIAYLDQELIPLTA